MEAYNKLYFADSTELAEQLFYTVSSENKWDFETFTAGFMSTGCRKMWDIGFPKFINMTWDELLEYLTWHNPEIFKSGDTSVDPLLAEWIGGMYNRVQFYSGKSSEEIYDKIPLNRMIELFRPLHTVDEDIATEKLLELI